MGGKFSRGPRSGRFFEPLERRRLLHAAVEVSAITPYNGQQHVDVDADVQITFDEAMNPATLTAGNVSLLDPSGNAVDASLFYNETTQVLTLNPADSLVSSAGYYTVRVAGGESGVQAADGAELENDVTASFTCGQPNLGFQTVISGLNLPTNIEFSPDGRVYVAEKSGLIKLFDSLSDTTPTVAADLRTNVHNFWDRGLLGMALDPGFTSGRPYIYVTYTYDGDIGGNAPKWGTAGASDDAGGPNPSVNGPNASARLSRFRVGPDGVMTGEEQVLINDWVDQFPSHNIGDVKFGPDGYLYVSGGDGASFNLVDTGNVGTNLVPDPANEGGALRSQDILSEDDPTTLDGTVIRVNPDTGLAAPDNPFGDSADLNRQRIIANGLRNPFRMTFKPGTNELYIADVGWNSFEEINRIADVTDRKVENFGWPAYEGYAPQPGYQGLELPLLQPLYQNRRLVTQPFFVYGHTEQIIPGSDEPTGGSSPTGLAFYEGSSYPQAYKGALFFCDFARQRVYVMYQGPDGQINPASRQMIGGFDPVELTTGPNGDIFAVNLYWGTVTRLVATGYRHAPVANVVADKTTGPLPLTVNFDASASTDPDGEPLTYAWDLDGDGEFDDSTAAKPDFTYTLPTDVTVRLRVTDTAGLTDVASVVIRPANTAPVPVISVPDTTLNYAVGDTIQFAGQATDAEDGTLAASQLTWKLSVIHANDIDPNNTHEHTVTSFAGVDSGSFVAPDHEAPSWLLLRLTATDSRGLSTTTSLRINPKTVRLTFNSTPTGLTITFNGTQHVAPFSAVVNANSGNSLSVPTSLTIDGESYHFASWSQGGAAGQIFNAPLTDTVYTAAYTPATVLPTGYVKLTGTPIGTTDASVPPENGLGTSFDGNLGTYFESSLLGAWVGLDLGTAQTITQIKFAPRDGLGGRMTGGRFQASNMPDFSSGVVDLYQVVADASSGVRTTASVNVPTAFRYVRYLSPTGSNANVSEIEFYTTVAARVPGLPENLSALVLANRQVQLSWTDTADNETGYVIQRRYAGWIWEDLPLTVGANATTVTDTSAIGNVTYEYRIAARNDVGDSLWTAPLPVSTFNVGTAPPAAPTGLTAVAVSGTQVNLAWVDNSATEIGFRVERRLPGGNFALLATLGANATTYADPTALAGVTYEYRVIATDGTTDSPPSNAVTVTTPTAGGTLPAAPSGLTVTRGPGNAVVLNWQDNSDNENAFRIERRYRGWVWDTYFTVGQGETTFTDTTGFFTCTYEYQVIAVNGAGDSTASNLAEILLESP